MFDFCYSKINTKPSSIIKNNNDDSTTGDENI